MAAPMWPQTGGAGINQSSSRIDCQQREDGDRVLDRLGSLCLLLAISYSGGT
jgi:hypothetical protein